MSESSGLEAKQNHCEAWASLSQVPQRLLWFGTPNKAQRHITQSTDMLLRLSTLPLQTCACCLRCCRRRVGATTQMQQWLTGPAGSARIARALWQHSGSRPT
jgi:hypothetical protein